MDTIAFAERVLMLLDEATTTSTYKYALLLSIMDICMEQTSQSGESPDVISTRKIAEHVAGLYWSQTLPFDDAPSELSQNSGRQAKIVSEISKYQHRNHLSANASFRNARIDGFDKLINSIETTVVDMPLSKLQNFASGEHRFIYDYQGKGNIYLREHVADYLVQLNGLLRPIIYRKWAAFVAKINNLKDSKLEEHLFNRKRIATRLTRPFLEDYQHGLCFYCGDDLKANVDVDHFIPWARYPNDCLENFVLAHGGCNRSKSSYLASKRHLDSWLLRFHDEEVADDFVGAARDMDWDSRLESSLGIARAVYLKLPMGTPLWVGGGAGFEVVEKYALRGSFHCG